MPLLSVLDQSPVKRGGTPADAIRETVELAEAVDRLGYQRYWLAEHHATPALACSCPEVLIGQVAARTSRIRVGSGGVMLSHYSPLEDAAAYPYTTQEQAVIRDARQRSIVGTPEQVRDRLLDLGTACGVEEFVVLTITHDFKARLRSYELLADTFGLARR